MALELLWQLTLEQSLFGEPMLNVFHYWSDTAGASSEDLAAAFQDDVLPLIEDIQSAEVDNARLRVYNLEVLTDFADFAITGTGGVGANPCQREIAVNYSFRLNTRAVRPGSKRFGGVPVSWVNPDGTFTSEALTAFNALRLKLDDDIQAAAGIGTYTPVVIGRVLETPDPPRKPFYRLPETELELAVKGYGEVRSVLLTARNSHQVSRGNGR